MHTQRRHPHPAQQHRCGGHVPAVGGSLKAAPRPPSCRVDGNTTAAICTTNAGAPRHQIKTVNYRSPVALDPPQLTHAIGRCNEPHELLCLAQHLGQQFNTIHVTALVTRLANLLSSQGAAHAPGSSSNGNGNGPLGRSHTDALLAWQTCQQLVQQHAAQLDARGVANICWGAAKIGACDAVLRPACSELVASLLQHPRAEPGAFNGQQLVNTVWAAATLELHPGNSWLQQVLTAAGRQLPSMTDEGLGMLLWSLERLGCGPPREWLASFYAASSRSCSGARQQNVATMLLALVRLGCQPDPAWVAQVLEASQGSLDAAEPVALANSLWAAAKLQIALPAAWLRQCYSAVHAQLAAFSHQQFSLSLWALGTLQPALQPPPQLLEDAAQELAMRHGAMCNHSFSQASWGLARLHYVPPKHQQVAWVAQCRARLPGMAPQAMLRCLQAAAAWGCSGVEDTWLLAAADTALQPAADGSHRPQLLVALLNAADACVPVCPPALVARAAALVQAQGPQWDAEQVASVGLALTRVGYRPGPGSPWLRSFLACTAGRMQQLQQTLMSPESAQPEAAGGAGAAAAQAQQPVVSASALSASCVSKLLLCCQRWDALASDATLAAMVALPDELWDPHSAANVAWALVKQSALLQASAATAAQQQAAQARGREQEQQQYQGTAAAAGLAATSSSAPGPVSPTAATGDGAIGAVVDAAAELSPASASTTSSAGLPNGVPADGVAPCRRAQLVAVNGALVATAPQSFQAPDLTLQHARSSSQQSTWPHGPQQHDPGPGPGLAAGHAGGDGGSLRVSLPAAAKSALQAGAWGALGSRTAAPLASWGDASAADEAAVVSSPAASMLPSLTLPQADTAYTPEAAARPPAEAPAPASAAPAPAPVGNPYSTSQSFVVRMVGLALPPGASSHSSSSPSPQCSLVSVDAPAPAAAAAAAAVGSASSPSADAALDGAGTSPAAPAGGQRWPLRSIVMVLWAAARLRVQLSTQQQQALYGVMQQQAALAQALDLVPLMWVAMQLHVPPPGAVLQRLLDSGPEDELQPAQLPTWQLFMVLHVLLRCRVRCSREWQQQLCMRLVQWLDKEGKPSVAGLGAAPHRLLAVVASLQRLRLDFRSQSAIEVPQVRLVWPRLRAATKHHLLRLQLMPPDWPANWQRPTPPLSPAAGTLTSASATEQLQALQVARAVGLLSPQAWSMVVVPRLQLLLTSLPAAQYAAWLGLVPRLRRMMPHSVLEELMLSWYIASGARLLVLSTAPPLLHRALFATAVTAAKLQMPVNAAWLSDALRAYTGCMAGLSPGHLAQVPRMLMLVRRVPPPRWQMHYVLLVRERLPGMRPRWVRSMLADADQLSPALGQALRRAVEETMARHREQQRRTGMLA